MHAHSSPTPDVYVAIGEDYAKDERRCCPLRERKIDGTSVYVGKILSLRVDRVELPNGRVATREVVGHPGAVAILAQSAPDAVVLVRQFRYPIGEVSLELPAGKLEQGEDPLPAAHRELAEETGYTAGNMQFVMSFYSTPGFSDERMHLYLATDLKAGTPQPDDDEFIDCLTVDRSTVAHMVDKGELTDAKTLVGLLWWLGRP